MERSSCDYDDWGEVKEINWKLEIGNWKLEIGNWKLRGFENLKTTSKIDFVKLRDFMAERYQIKYIFLTSAKICGICGRYFLIFPADHAESRRIIRLNS
jgi:hypothetical protein